MQANGLRPGTWYEIRAVARSAAGETTALYRAATHTHNGGLQIDSFFNINI